MYTQSNTPTHRMPPTRRKPFWSSWYFLGGMLAFGTMIMLLLVAVLVLVLYGTPSESASPQVAAGVQVAGLVLGGETVEDANAALAQYNFGAQPITLTDETRSWSLTQAELGVRVDLAATGQRIETAAPNTTVQPYLTIDLAQTQAALITLSEQVNIAAVPGDPPQMGRAIDIPGTLNRLYVNLDGELVDGVLDLSMIITEPPALSPAEQYTGEAAIHVVEAGQELALIARLYDVAMNDIVVLNELANPDLLYVGQELLIPASGLYMPSAAEAPATPTMTGKSIVVATQDQRIYAYENGQMVHSYLVSTGRSATPTVKGDFKIYVKYEADDMSGPDYYLPQVPYTMYFYQGYAIHGTYWHNSFGRPMSHGCVNLPTEQARWFFEWATVGTPVHVI